MVLIKSDNISKLKLVLEFFFKSSVKPFKDLTTDIIANIMS